MGMTRRNTSQTHEEFVALGNVRYKNAVKAMMGTIGDLHRSIEAWNNVLGRLGEPVEEENSKVTERRKEHVALVVKATKKIEEVNAIHDEVTKRRTTLTSASLASCFTLRRSRSRSSPTISPKTGP
jgi:hypothetical protein